MYQQINQRLAELNREFEQGNARLEQVERERAELRETLLRIQGAILALKELSGDAGRHDPAGNTVDSTAEISIPAGPDDEAAED